MEEEHEEGSALEGPNNRVKPLEPQGPPRPEFVVHKLQWEKAVEEQSRVARRELVRKQGTDWGVGKPSREELRD